MPSFKPILLASSLSLFISGVSQAAQIDTIPKTEKLNAAITVKGTLAPGDEKTFIKQALLQDYAVVIFDSEGGDLNAGLEIGKVIRMKGFSTYVDENTVCASACALAWLGGVDRLSARSAQIGFHAAYADNKGIIKETGSGNAAVGAYVSQLGLPMSAITYVTSAPPEGMNWLTEERARDLGIAVTLLPVEQSSETTTSNNQQASPAVESNTNNTQAAAAPETAEHNNAAAAPSQTSDVMVGIVSLLFILWFVLAWFTHFYICLRRGKWVLFTLGFMFPVVGAIHGTILWCTRFADPKSKETTGTANDAVSAPDANWIMTSANPQVATVAN